MAKAGRPKKKEPDIDELLYSDGSPRNPNEWSKDANAERLGDRKSVV